MPGLLEQVFSGVCVAVCGFSCVYMGAIRYSANGKTNQIFSLMLHVS